MLENYIPVRDLDVDLISYKNLKTGDSIFSIESIEEVKNLFEKIQNVSVNKGDKLIFDRVVCVYKKQNSSEESTSLLVHFEENPDSKFILKDSQVKLKEEK